MGYYALPLLWRDSVIGWVNVVNQHGEYQVQPGFVSGSPPKTATFQRAYEAETEALRAFLIQRSRRTKPSAE